MFEVLVFPTFSNSCDSESIIKIKSADFGHETMPCRHIMFVCIGACPSIRRQDAFDGLICLNVAYNLDLKRDILL